MSELPKEWTKTTVGELADSIQYGHTASSTSEHVGPRFLRITDIQENRVDWETVPFCQIPQSQIPKYRLAKGDLVFARTGATVGKSFLIQTEIPESIFASYLIRVRVTKAIEARYLYYYFQSSDYWHQISDSSSGIGQPNVNGKKLAAITLPIAPLLEQRRIVARIEELFSRLDAGVAALRHAKAQLQRYRQSVLAAAVTGELTQTWRDQHLDTESASALLKRILQERKKQWGGRGKYKEPVHPEIEQMPKIPESWKWARLDTLCEIRSGMSVSKNRKLKHPVEVAYLRVANVQRGRLDLEEIKTMTIEKDRLDDLRLRNGDILFNEGGDRDKLGRGWVWEGQLDPCITQNHVFRATPYDADSTMPEFVSHWGNSFGQQFFLDEGTQTTNLASINKGVLSSFPIPVPPRDEQIQILEELDVRISAINRLEAELSNLLGRAQNLRQSILRSAFSGCLVAQNSSDPPAKELLEAIRTTKEAEESSLKTTQRKRSKRMEKRTLLEIILASPNGITPESLLAQSDYTEDSIEEFYRDLAKLRDKIIEERPKGSKPSAWPEKPPILIKAISKKNEDR